MVSQHEYSELVVKIAQGLQALMNVQEVGASHLPPQLHAMDDADFRTAALGFFVELGELVNECQWKPWRTYDPPTPAEQARVLKEMADVLHFLPWLMRNLEERFNLGSYDWANAFVQAHEENVTRFQGRVPGREPPPPSLRLLDGSTVAIPTTAEPRKRTVVEGD